VGIWVNDVGGGVVKQWRRGFSVRGFRQSHQACGVILLAKFSHSFNFENS